MVEINDNISAGIFPITFAGENNLVILENSRVIGIALEKMISAYNDFDATDPRIAIDSNVVIPEWQGIKVNIKGYDSILYNVQPFFIVVSMEDWEYIEEIYKWIANGVEVDSIESIL